jgi:hypothetical protein
VLGPAQVNESSTFAERFKRVVDKSRYAQNPSMSENGLLKQLTLNGRTFAGYKIRLPVSRMSIWTQAFRTGNQAFLETALS